MTKIEFKFKNDNTIKFKRSSVIYNELGDTFICKYINDTKVNYFTYENIIDEFKLYENNLPDVIHVISDDENILYVKVDEHDMYDYIVVNNKIDPNSTTVFVAEIYDGIKNKLLKII